MRIRRCNTINIFALLLLLLGFNCKESSEPYDDGSGTLFTSIPESHSNIDFRNTIEETPEFNFLNYSYIYNGGGVAVGDINNDGLDDLYFTSNQQSNKLYLNKGNFQFEDITDSAGVSDQEGWSTGVTMIDINNDGWLDIYVCKSGSLNNRSLRQNKLYINQKDNTFKDEALNYGLKEYSFSTQAYFFDYDKDGDLDIYLVNHSTDANAKTLILSPQQQASLKIDSRDILFKNENGIYKNVSRDSGISSMKAWGLSASIGDFNNDSWPDIYVANDFFEPDFLYINNQDGTFTNEILKAFKHIPNNSMGSDFADINNDLYPDLVVLDMMAADRKRGKENMASMDTDQFNRMVAQGFHHQYMSNMLQLNNGNTTYSDIGQFSGIAKTDWSWAPLIADFNNDGLNDLFVTNGIEKDLANQDFRTAMRGKDLSNIQQESLDEALELIPSAKLPNYMFINKGDYKFEDRSKDLGFDAAINSNGAAYADLDNDGDLDLVINNQSDKASIYRNNSEANFLNISLKGPEQNIGGIGTRIELYSGDNKQLRELHVSRGYQSSVGHSVNFGLGESTKVDSLKVIWPDNKIEILTNIAANSTLNFNYANASATADQPIEKEKLFSRISPSQLGITYEHKTVTSDDYAIQLLLPQKQSTIDNSLQVADVNNDGLDDFFVGNTSGRPSELYIQTRQGTFNKSNQKLFQSNIKLNDNNALFFDADNDNDLDLYVASGNYHEIDKIRLHQDRLYINNGKGIFSKGQLPEMLSITKAIAAGDFDNDGDIDLFVGGRVISRKYPEAPESYLLENRNGQFVNVTSQKAEGLKAVGLVNDAIFSDYDNDGDHDLIVVGEWMPVTFFNNDNGTFTKDELLSSNNSGWFQTIKVRDIDGDGDEDYFVGNFGQNNKFHPSEKKPLHIYANYFDDNNSYDIALTKESDGDLFPVRGKECSSEQTPFLKEKIGTYSEFANSNIFDVYGQENIDTALHLQASSFSSYYIENKGDQNFEYHPLPNEAQFGPTLDFEFIDINNDGTLEVIGVGAIYDAEVETIRYDASNGFILNLNDGVISTYQNLINITSKEAKAIERIIIKGQPHLLILNANDELDILRLK
ncbi:VCBS repeat-containing protein [Winogradskyella tangerina]|uniref:VCBS repeat-containing protein n=1 Tax=Winogradskyella tangerina TaxID=2023240 RepID=UPI000DBE1080|nr:VCBS repeat-containing protein [Winogradskyella tangerina]